MHSQIAAGQLLTVTAENNLDMAIFNLMQKIGLRQPNLIKVDTSIPDDDLLKTNIDVEAALATSEEGFSEVKAAQALLEAAQAGIQVVRSSKLPVITLNTQLATRTSSARNDEFGQQIVNNFNQQMGVNMFIPIFNNHLFRYNTEIAKLEFELMKTNYNQIRDELKQRIFSAVLDYKAAYRKYVTAQTSFKALVEEHRFAERQLNLGIINSTDYGLIRSRFLSAQSELMQNKYDCIFKAKILGFYQGRL